MPDKNPGIWREIAGMAKKLGRAGRETHAFCVKLTRPANKKTGNGSCRLFKAGG
jgi:hypothetical protein